MGGVFEWTLLFFVTAARARGGVKKSTIRQVVSKKHPLY